MLGVHCGPDHTVLPAVRAVPVQWECRDRWYQSLGSGRGRRTSAEEAIAAGERQEDPVNTYSQKTHDSNTTRKHTLTRWRRFYIQTLKIMYVYTS